MSPPLDPPPTDQSDHRGKKRNLPLEQSGRAIVGTQTFAPPPPPPAWTRRVHPDAPGQRHGQQPVSGTTDPRSSQTGQVIRGLR